MLRKRVSDQEIKRLLEEVSLDYLIDREGGLDGFNDWNDVLSGIFFCIINLETNVEGGEKQRIAMARLFYHKPTFAILGIFFIWKSRSFLR